MEGVWYWGAVDIEADIDADGSWLMQIRSEEESGSGRDVEQ